MGHRPGRETPATQTEPNETKRAPQGYALPLTPLWGQEPGQTCPTQLPGVFAGTATSQGREVASLGLLAHLRRDQTAEVKALVKPHSTGS